MIFFCFDDLKLSRTSFPLRVFFFAVAIDTKTCFTAFVMFLLYNCLFR